MTNQSSNKPVLPVLFACLIDCLEFGEGLEPRAYMIGKHATIEFHPEPLACLNFPFHLPVPTANLPCKVITMVHLLIDLQSNFHYTEQFVSFYSAFLFMISKGCLIFLGIDVSYLRWPACYYVNRPSGKGSSELQVRAHSSAMYCPLWILDILLRSQANRSRTSRL